MNWFIQTTGDVSLTTNTLHCTYHMIRFMVGYQHEDIVLHGVCDLNTLARIDPIHVAVCDGGDVLKVDGVDVGWCRRRISGITRR